MPLSATANFRAGPRILPALPLALAAIMLANLLVSPAVCAPQVRPALVYVEPSQDDLLLVAIQLGQTTLSSDLDGYLCQGGIFLPLGELCRLLEFGVSTNPAAGTANGSLASPNHIFSLDLVKRQAVVDGKPLPVRPEMIQLHRNDIYVDVRLLSQWLPVDLDFSKSDAMVRVHAREPLPILMRMERQKKATRAEASMGLQDNGYELVSNPYRMFGFSAVDQRLTLSMTPSGEGGQPPIAYSTMAAGDLFGMGTTAMLFSNGVSQTPTGRLTLSRIDPSASLLGGLSARSLYLGDIYAPAQPLLLRSRPARGLMVSSYPINQQDQFDTHTFQGTILPGWDVELYRDDVLIDYKMASDDGRYEFRDVPLLFGLNVFKLVFYGPRGERREEEKRFNVGRSLISPGQFYYRMAMNGTNDSPAKFVLQNDYGLRRDLSINTTVSSLRLDGQDQDYASVGLRSCLGGVFFQSDTAFERGGGSATELALQTMIGNVSVGLRHTMLDDFTSEIYLPHTDQLRSLTSLRLDGIRMPSRLHLSQMSLGIETERTALGARTTRFTDRISTTIHGLRLSHYMDFETQDLPGVGQQSVISRTLVVSKRFRHTELRGELHSGISSGSQLNDLLLSVERDLPRGRILSAGVLRSADTGQTSVMASYNKNQGSCGLGYTARYDSWLGVSAGVNLFLGLGLEPREGTIHSDANSMAQTGAASLRAFLDSNANGKIDSGEKPLEGVKFAVNSTIRDSKTDANGVALLTGLQGYQPIDVSVVESSLEDPLWIPEKKGFRLMPRVGSALMLDVPIIATGEISGTVRLNESGVLRECPGAKIELVDGTGNVIMAVQSEYDGFFMLSKVLPGKYALRLAADQMAFADCVAASRTLEVPAAGAYLDGLDIALVRGESSPATTASEPEPNRAESPVGGG